MTLKIYANTAGARRSSTISVACNGDMTRSSPVESTILYQLVSYLYERLFRQGPTTILASNELYRSTTSLDAAEFSLINLRTREAVCARVFTSRPRQSISTRFNEFESNLRDATEEILQDSDGTLLLIPLRSSTSPESECLMAAGPRGIFALSSATALYDARLPFAPCVDEILLELPLPTDHNHSQVFRFPLAPEKPIRISFRRPSNDSAERFSGLVHTDGKSLTITDIRLEIPSRVSEAHVVAPGEFRTTLQRTWILPTPEASIPDPGLVVGQWCQNDDHIGVVAPAIARSMASRRSTGECIPCASDLEQQAEDNPQNERTTRLDRSMIAELLQQRSDDETER